MKMQRGPSAIEEKIRRQAMIFAGIGLYRYRFDGKIVAMDPVAFNLLDLQHKHPSEETVIGQNIEEVVDYESKGTLRTQIQEQGEVHGYEWSLRTATGEERLLIEDCYLLAEPETGDESILVVVRDITERRRIEEALQTSLEQYRSTLDAMPDAVHVVDRDLRILFFNQAFRRFSEKAGLSSSPVGWTIFEAFPFLPPLVREQYESVFSTGTPLVSEEISQVHGKTFYTQTRKIPVIEKGRVIRVVTVLHDLTESHQAEVALRESEEKYRTLVEMLPHSLSVFQDGKVMFTNEATRRMFRYPESGPPLGQDILAVVPEAEKVRLMGFVRDRMSGRPDAPERYETVLRRADGEEFPAEVFVRMIAYSGRLAEQVLVADITEQRRAQDALAASEALYRELFENANDLVYTHDLQGRMLSLNKAGETLTGYSREEALTMNVLDVVAPEDRELAKEMVLRKVFDSEPTQYELEILSKDGRRIPVEVSTRVIERNGEPFAIQGIARDISERRRAEQERIRLEAQMQHAQKLEGLGVLAGGIAHDFNNLLVGIMGYAGLAATRTPPESPVHTHIQRIEQSAQRAAELTNQLLAYSGRGMYVIQPLDLSRLASEMGHLLSAAVSKKAQLRYECQPNLPLIEGDTAQIHQVVMNLITNASDAIGEDEGVITIRTFVQDANAEFLSTMYVDDGLLPGRYVCLEVSDTGCGMDDETLTRMFDPFFSTKFAGRGLGLAAVLGIVRSHKGGLQVQSGLGKGTAFRVFFPVRTVEENEGMAFAAAPDFGQLGEWKGAGVILVADDEAPARAVAREAFEMHGFTVLTAENGREAVDMFRANAEAVVAVLLDLTMPVMNGDEALEHIHAIRPDVPVVLSSGYTEQDCSRRFTSGGPAAFVQKPYLLSQLIACFRSVLDKERPA